MRTVVASDNRGAAGRVREILLHGGHDCQTSDLVALHHAAGHIGQARPDLLVLVLSPDTEHGLNVLREVRQTFRGHVVVLGPVTDARLILRSQREGADLYLDEEDLEAELASTLQRLHVEDTSPQTEPGRLIAVLSPSGGGGASTIAANLAILLAQGHKSCGLIDLKLETGDQAALLNLKPNHTLAEVCRNASRLDRSMFERSLVQHDSGVSLLAPPRLFEDVVHVTPEGVRAAVQMARALFPYVVVDLDHSFREEQVVVLRQADPLLLVFRLEFTSLRHTRRTLDHLDKLGVARERVRLVVNRYGQPKEVPAAKAEEALDLKIAYYIPDEPKTINRANNNGVPAVLEAPRASVCRSLGKLVQGVNGHLPKG